MSYLKLLIITGIFLGTFACFSCKISKPYLQLQTDSKIVSDTLKDSIRLAVFKGDTIGYLNYLIRNQEKYRGKPLSVFLNDVDLTIMRFSMWPNPKDRRIIYNIELSANEMGHPSKIGKNGEIGYIEIGIRWQTYVPYDSIKAINDANGSTDRGRWSKKAEEYFGKQIVGNLWLNYYMKRE